MGKTNPNASQKTARRRVFKFTLHADPMTQEEAAEWLGMLERLLGTGGQVAKVLDITPVTYSRWKNGKAPTAWYWRGVFSNVFNEIATTLNKKDKATGYIPVQKYPDVSKRLKAARFYTEKYLSASGAQFTVDVSEGEEVSRRHAAITWLYAYMKRGKVYDFIDISEDAKEAGVSTANLYFAANFLKVKKKKTMVYDGDKPKGTASKWTRDLEVDMSPVETGEEE